MKAIKKLAHCMGARMREIDMNISTRELLPGEQDECPTGEDFNLLWDAILDEFEAAGFPIEPLRTP